MPRNKVPCGVTAVGIRQKKKKKKAVCSRPHARCNSAEPWLDTEPWAALNF